MESNTDCFFSLIITCKIIHWTKTKESLCLQNVLNIKLNNLFDFID